VDLERYDRQLRMPEIGQTGQERLGRASALVIGAGGLGSPNVLYLAAAGVGRLGIVDDDVVSLSNLNRQILHRTADVGSPKVASAARAVRELNPAVSVELWQERVDARRVAALAADYDVLVDATDGFASKLAVSDGAVLADKPLVHAGVEGMIGQLAVLGSATGPCLRCLFPSLPPEPANPRPILGAAAGALGAMQAAEVLKLLLGTAGSVLGTLLVVDLWTLRFRRIAVDRAADCPVCAAAAREG
jgi:molybdopterin/thiamine biosynthesis adenylyltransferase